MYHSIEPEGSKRVYEHERFYNITPDKFREQVDYLKRNSYNSVSINDLLRIENDYDLPRRPIMLTFDDGHVSHYDTVLPILKDAGFTGVFFLVSNDIGKEYRINWDGVKALKRAGMDIGSHGVNHDTINKLPYQNLIIELKASKIELEDNLGTEIIAFAIPRGFYSPKISNVARGMGYKFVFTSFTGNSTLYSNPYRMRRIVMRSSYTMKEFISIVRKDPIFLAKKRLEQFTKNGIQKAVGIKRYERIKKAVFSKA